MHEGDRFDAWLEVALRRALGPAEREAPPPGYRAPRRAGGLRLRLASGAGAALAAKAATGFAAVAFAVGLTGTALTGSPDPAAWGATAQGAARECRAGAGDGGLGGCVAALAQPHGGAAAPVATVAAAASDQRPAVAVTPTPRGAPAASAPRSGEAAGPGPGRSPAGPPAAERTPRPHPSASPGTRRASGGRRGA